MKLIFTDFHGNSQTAETCNRAITFQTLIYPNKITISGIDSDGQCGIGAGFLGQKSFEIGFCESNRLHKVIFGISKKEIYHCKH